MAQTEICGSPLLSFYDPKWTKKWFVNHVKRLERLTDSKHSPWIFKKDARDSTQVQRSCLSVKGAKIAVWCPSIVFKAFN